MFSPVFQTTVLQACQIAILNHKEEKLEALRNAVLNSSIPSSLNNDILLILLKWIDDFTTTHLSILKCLHYLDQYKPDELKAQFSELENNQAIYNQILKDLVERGLINLREVYITEEESKNNYFYLPNVPPDISHLENRRRPRNSEAVTNRKLAIKALAQ